METHLRLFAAAVRRTYKGMVAFLRRPVRASQGMWSDRHVCVEFVEISSERKHNLYPFIGLTLLYAIDEVLIVSFQGYNCLEVAMSG